MINFKKLVKRSVDHINGLNKNKFFIGIIMILSNVAPKFTDLGFSKAQKYALQSALGREILIFSAVFIGEPLGPRVSEAIETPLLNGCLLLQLVCGQINLW